MTEQLDRRADVTRLQILQAAARQFAHKPYSAVSLDDILADAAVTKGALYFHFRSKYALASSIVEHRAQLAREQVGEVLARNLSAVETLVDISYQVTVDDIGEPMARAAGNLLESVGRTDRLGPQVLEPWIAGYAKIIRRGIEEGDFADGTDPHVAATLLVSMQLGIRQTSDLDDPQRFLTDLEQAWKLVLPGLTNPDRLGYLDQFIRRRTIVALKKALPIKPAEAELDAGPAAGSA
ncbi:TetR/AcrR family transcriptional regulator [Mycobacterium sp. 141]|uniref:TetR/AcrR family transcriptional regulator n=1 Tax=Mycobacterium sp. 141 TaxID=1120797 RepID=UPI00036541F8|nr:TetR/AcrR family transcriptional regulator [Mycobacterium sp. 141]